MKMTPLSGRSVSLWKIVHYQDFSMNRHARMGKLVDEKWIVTHALRHPLIMGVNLQEMKKNRNIDRRVFI